MSMTMWRGETLEVPFPVEGVNPANGSIIDPTASALTVGFSRSESDGQQVRPNNYFAGTWAANPDGTFWGSVLVGPDGVVDLIAGRWTLWAQFTLGGETITRPVPGVLTVQ